jgi:hypothetical protein
MGPLASDFRFLARISPGRRRMSSSAPRHIPVLGHQAVALLTPRDGGIYVDATFGAGGYSRMILDIPGTRVLGIDRDRSAIAGGFDLVEQSAGRLTLVEDRFSNLAEICAAQGLQGRRRRDGYRGVLDAARRGRARLLVSSWAARSTCGWAMTVRPRRM